MVKKPKEEPVILPERILVEISAEDITKGGKSFCDNPVITGLKRRGLPVYTVGPDLAFIGGKEYLAEVESAEKLGHYLFNQEPLVPYTHVLDLSSPRTVEQRCKLRREDQLEKIVGFRETREEK